MRGGVSMFASTITNIPRRSTRRSRDADGNVIRTEQAEVKVKVWQRVPCGGKLTIDLVEGVVSHRAPDGEHPEVRVQGTIRGKNANGDRLVTLFLVNAQQEPEENKDSAWVFQPELIVRAAGDSADKAIFRRRVALSSKDDDEERKALEMIYRKQVEFAVGHGVAVHAKTDDGDAERAHEVRTVVMPQYEVPVTETPGLRPEDRPAMREMVEKGHLDMEVLADMDRSELVAVLIRPCERLRAVDRGAERPHRCRCSRAMIPGCCGSRSLQGYREAPRRGNCRSGRCWQRQGPGGISFCQPCDGATARP